MKISSNAVAQKYLRRLVVAFLVIFNGIFISSSSADEQSTVTLSIRPIHSIASFIMKGVARPNLLIDGTQSAHHASLKPSQAKTLSRTDLLIWVGPQMEAGLAKPIAALATSAIKIMLLESKRLTIIESEQNVIDPHIWLSPENASKIGEIIAAKLIKIDPANQQKYQSNLRQFIASVNSLEKEVIAIIGETKPDSLLVYHDSLKYFANRFGVTFLALSKGSQEISPSAKRVAKISRLLRSDKYACLFVEAGESFQRINPGRYASNTKLVIFNPLGAEYSTGPQLYFELIRGLANKISSCAQEK